MVTKEELNKLKLNLEELLDKSFEFEFEAHKHLFDKKGLYDKFRSYDEDESFNEYNITECSEIALWIRESRSAYLAPAYCFNKYIDALILDMWWDDIKYSLDEDDRPTSTFREYSKNIELQNTLISIKMALDRFVYLFSLFYKGVSKNSTFGHIDETNDGKKKAKGFMSYVVSKKDEDELLQYVFNQYNEWIKACVFPRDAIIHYQDCMTCYSFQWDEKKHEGAEFSFQFNSKDKDSVIIDYLSLSNFTEHYYDFYNNIFEMLFAKGII